MPLYLSSAVIDSNKTRKLFVVSEILIQYPKIVGVYKLAMKRGSDNCRSSAIFDIIQELQAAGVRVFVYDPAYENEEAFRFLVFEKNLKAFKDQCDLIIANRFNEELGDIRSKVLTRDLFRNN